MILKDGNVGAIVVGILIALAAIVVGIFSSTFGPAVIWVAIVLFIVGLGIVLFSSSITIDMNKTRGQIMYQTKRLIGGRAATYAVADVLRIETRKSWRMVGSTQRGGRVQQIPISQSVIIFKDGKELPLDHQTNSFGVFSGPAILMQGSGKEVAEANLIATFLGVPFQEIAPPGGPMNINIGGGAGI